MPDVLETIARGIHRADELKGAPPWEQQSFFVREAQMDRARAAHRALEQAGFLTLHAQVVLDQQHDIAWLARTKLANSKTGE